MVCILLVFGGWLYRWAAHRWGAVAESQIKLPVPLSEFPRQIGLWKSEEVPLPQAVQKIAANDDFVSRVFFKSDHRESVGFYVAYTARPRTMLGHRPESCYPAVGWVADGTDKITIGTMSGREVPCLLHQFHRSAPLFERIVVLNFYIVNGELTIDESVFSGVDWRTPNIKGDIARYVAQVQISGSGEAAVKDAASELTEKILEYLPDKNGHVQAAQARRP